MKKIFSSLIISGLAALLLLIRANNASAQVAYTLSLSEVVKNDTLYLSYNVQRNSGSTAFAFGNSNFVVNIDTSLFDLSRSVIVPGTYTWSNNSNYQNLLLSYSNQYQSLSLDILKKTTGTSGVTVPVGTTLIGTIGIPIKSCGTNVGITWRQIFPATSIQDWNGTDILSYATFSNPSTLANLCPSSISTTVTAFPSSNICKGDTVSFVASVSTTYDKINFYRNDTLVQSGTSSVYTLINPPNGTYVYANAVRCGCISPNSSTTTLNVDNINVNLGPDQRLCKNPITLNAGTFSAGIEYQWNTSATTSSINVSAAGTYSVIVYRPNGCFDRDTVVINPRLTMGTPNVFVGTITGTSIQFTWNSDANATTYQYSTDSASWTSDATFSHTIGGLSTNTSKCFWVRFINYCDTMVSAKVCGTTASGCKVVYSKPKDTALCSAGSVNINLTNINPPTYEIYWNGSGTATTTTAYAVAVTKDTTITFRVADPGIAGCFMDDSVHINYVPVNDAGFVGLDTSYCITGNTSILKPNQSGGVFTGVGVDYNYTSDLWYFKPSVAGAGSHTITYSICNLSSSQNTVVLSDTCVSSVFSDSSASAVTEPQGIYTDCDGNIFVSINSKNIIIKIDSTGSTSIVVGDSSQVGSYASGSISVARINSPIGVTVGPDGTIYFVDSGNQMVRMVKGGVVYDIAGVQGVAAASKPGAAPVSPGTSAKFNKPFGIVLNPAGDKLYVSDQTYGQIREIDLTVPGYSVSVLAGGGIVAINNPAGIAPLTADMVQPSHLTIDNNYLYITDAATESVYVYEFSTGLIKPYAGKYNQVGNALGDTSVATFNGPSGISVTCNGSLFVVDQLSNSIKLVDPNNYKPSIHVLNFAGANSSGGQGSALSPLTGKIFKLPTAVSTFVKGYIDIADTGNNRILRLSMGAYAPQPWKDFQQDFTYCAYDKADTLTPPCNGVYSGSGIVYSGGVVKFDPSVAGAGVHTITYTYTSGYCMETDTKTVTVYATPTPQFLADSMICSNEFKSYQLDAGSGFTTYAWYKNGVLDPTVTIPYYTVTSTGTYTVKVTNTGGCIGSASINMQTKPSPSVSITSTSDSLCYGGSAVLTASGSIVAPYSITKYIWNTGSSGSSLIVNASGDYIATVTATNGCKASSTHRITERDAINVCMAATTPSGVDLGYGKYTQSVFAGKGVTGNGNFNFSSLNNIYYDQTGEYLYVTEGGSSNDVRRVRVSDTTVSLYAGVPGSGGFNNGTLSASQFNSPYGIIKLPNGKFVLADSSNELIRLLDPLNVSTLAGGTSTIGVKDGTDTSARFNAPYGIATDIFGNIYVTDYNNNKIRKITSSGVVTTIAGDSSSAALSGLINGVSYVSRFNHPKGMAFDIEGNLYVADAGNNVIRKITRDTVVSTFVAGLNNPGDIAIDKKGNIYVSDSGSKTIKKIDKYGTVTSIATGISNPGSISIDPVTERIYFVEKDSSRISTLIKNKTVTICQGDSVNINATCTKASSYQWTPSFDLTSVSSGNVIVYPSTTTTYYLTATSSSGCTKVDSITIFVNPKPIANAGTDTTFCFGGSKKLGSLSVVNNVYSWTATPSAYAGLSQTNISNPTAKPTKDSTVTYSYFLSVQDTLTRCKNRDTALVTLNFKPTANAGKDTSVCEGLSVQIGSATTAGLSYKWTPNTWLSSDLVSNPVSTPLDTITYTLIVKTAAMCSDTDSVVVIFNPKPFADAGTDTTLCLGASKQLGTTNVAGDTYQWIASPAGNGLSSTTIYNPVAIPTAVNTYKYKLTVTDAKGCKNIDSAQVIVNSVPVHNAIQKVSLCIGDSTVISGPSAPVGFAYSYLWSPKYGMRLSDTSNVSSKVSPSIDTTYFVKVTLGSCFDKDTVKVKVNARPVANAGTDTIMCLGGTKQLGESPVSKSTYTWSVSPAGASGDLIQNNIANPSVTPSVANVYVYTVIVSDSNTCRDTSSATITVKALPVWTPLQKVTICRGDSTQIGPVPNGYSYSWSPSKGLSSTTIANPNASPSNDTLYIATLSLAYPGGPTCYNTDSVFVTVNSKPAPSFTSAIACAQDTVRFTASPDTLTYKWDFGDGATSTSLNPLHTYNASGIFTVKLITTSSKGCIDSVSANIPVNKKPTAYYTDSIACAGYVNFRDSSYSNDTTSINKWYWDFKDGNIYTKQDTSHVYLNAGNYDVTLVVTTTQGCKDTVNNIIPVRYLKLSVANDTTVCAGTTGKLSCLANGGVPPYNYLWTTVGPGIILVPSDSVTTVKTDSSGMFKYYISVISSANCTVKDSMNVSVVSLPVVNAGRDTSMCSGMSITLQGSSSDPNFGINSVSWSPQIGLSAPTSDTTLATPPSTTTQTTISYILSAIGKAYSCVNRDTIILTVNPLPKDSIILDQPVACKGSLAVLSVDSSNRANKINWIDITTGNTLLDQDTVKLSVSVSGLYKVTIVNPVTGCADSSSKSVTFVNPPSGVVVKGPAASCVNEPFLLTAVAAGDSLHYKWISNGSGIFLDSLNDSTIYVPDLSDPASLDIKFIAYNTCANMPGFDTIQLNPIPLGSFTYSPAQNFAEDTVNFINGSDTVMYNITKWAWNFKDGDTSAVFSPQHAFQQPGIYDVEMKITNNYGCSYIYDLPVEIYDIHVLFIPNAFSPFANNSENRTCKIYGEKISPDGFSFSIFNRWGDMVYQTSSLSEAKSIGWDGTNPNKEPQSMGVFTYVVKGSWEDGKSISKTGTITLIR